MEECLTQMLHSGSREKQENITMPAENIPPGLGTSTSQGSSSAPAGPISLKFWLKTRKSILNEFTMFQIPTPNRLGARIEKKTPRAESAPPPKEMG